MKISSKLTSNHNNFYKLRDMTFFLKELQNCKFSLNDFRHQIFFAIYVQLKIYRSSFLVFTQNAFILFYDKLVFFLSICVNTTLF